jgi:hypothetical protein
MMRKVLIIVGLCYALSGCSYPTAQKDSSTPGQDSSGQSSVGPVFMQADQMDKAKVTPLNWYRQSKEEKNISRMIQWVELSRN